MQSAPSPAALLPAPGNSPTPYYILNRLLRNPKRYGVTAVYRWNDSYMLRLGVDEERCDALLFLDAPQALAHLAAAWQGKLRILYAFHTAYILPDHFYGFSADHKPRLLESFFQYRLPLGIPLRQDAPPTLRPLTGADRKAVLTCVRKLRRYGDVTLTTLSDSLRELPCVGFFNGQSLKLCCWVHELGTIIPPTTCSDKDRTITMQLLCHVAAALRKMSVPVLIHASVNDEKYQSLLRLIGFQPQGYLTILRF